MKPSAVRDAGNFLLIALLYVGVLARPVGHPAIARHWCITCVFSCTEFWVEIVRLAAS